MMQKEVARNPLMMQRVESQPSSFLDSSDRGVQVEEDYLLMAALNLSVQNPSHAATVPTEEGMKALQASLHPSTKTSPSCTRRGTEFGVGQYSFCEFPVGGLNEQGQPARYFWSHTPFSPGDLLNCKVSLPSYWQDPE